DLILGEAPGLLAVGRHRTLEEWLSGLPRETREADPWLAFWYGACRAPFRPEEAIPDLERAYAGFEARADPTGLYLAWSEIVSAHAFYSGDLRPLDHWLEQLDALGERFPGFPDPEVGLRVATSAAVALMWHRPDPQLVRVWEERILATVHSGPLTGPALMATIQIGLYHASLGRLDRTGTVLELIRRRMDAPETPALLRTGADLLEAIIAQYGCDNDAWIQATERGLQRVADTGIRGLEPSFLSLAVYGHLNAQDLPAAHRFLDRFSAVADQSPPADRAHYHEVLAWTALAEGQGAEALEQARLARELITRTGMPFGEAFIQLALTLSRGTVGDFRGAHEELERAHALAEFMASPMLLQACAFARAYLSHIQGDAEVRRQALGEALELGEQYGLYNSALSFPWLLRPLLQVAVHEGLSGE
ncbi:MAG TPA: hypothetical protein VKA48_00060, partial [Gammaproteobacteria bacterium]|nr:hypothetical protein [Gammaproteobacteria bacterium]